MLTVHRAEKANHLIAPLTGVLLAAPSDPLAPEVIAVPSRGVERWISQQLALSLGATGARDGIAANIEFPSPAALVGDVLARAADLEPGEDPWTSPRLEWGLIEVIDSCAAAPWSAVLAHHLGLDGGVQEHRAGRRYATAALLARLFGSYGDNRPAMLTDWARSHDTDGAGDNLTHDLCWQPALWRRLREHLGVPSPAERLQQACAQLRESRELAGLPERLSLFGPTRLSRTHLAVLDALAAQREVHLWLTHPSPAMWAALAATPASTRRSKDRSALKLSNPLLANLSRDIRELQRRLPEPFIDEHHDRQTAAGCTVLARIQQDIADDRAPGSQARLPADDTVAVHACHGPTRQVEVLREQLLHLLAGDNTLQPRDIIVLCPDVEIFAPLITAAFAPTEARHPGHRIRVRLADRGLARLNPLLETIATLVALADGRVTAGEVLDLAATAAVARRFGFADADQDTLRQWTFDSGARWGLSQSQRQRFGLSQITQNTFAQARDRLLLGVTADETDLRWLGDALPLDAVDSADVDLAGRFVEYLDRLEAALARLSGPQTPQRWQQALHAALEELTATGDADAWQRAQAGRLLTEALTGAGEREISLADIRNVLAAVLAPRPTRANFRTGDLTVATLVPMRFVPHRVVAIIGLDDGCFPRVGHLSGDDILAVDPCVGERDPRSEDRQVLLDALMSAIERVVICYTGADPVTGKPCPPVPPLADIIDTVTATVEPGATVIHHQPLQPHDPANFEAPQPFSYDTQNFVAAREATRDPRPRPAFLPAPLPAVPAAEVSLEDLIAFVVHPGKAFLHQRLEVSLWQDDDSLDDRLPLALDGLQKWQIGDRMLAEMLAHPASDAADRFTAAEQRRGTLPPGRFGEATMAEISAGVDVVARVAVATAGAGQMLTRQVLVDIGSIQLSGSVNGVYAHQLLLSASYSALKPKHRLVGWVRLLALAASGYPLTEAVTLGRMGGADPAVRRSVLTVPPDPAELLAQLVELRAAGLRYPLPMAVDTSYAYAERRLRTPPADGYQAAVETWRTPGGSWGISNDNTDPALVCIYGPDAPFSVLWDHRAPQGHQWYDEPNWFAQLAVRVWGPLLAQESLTRVR
jgi:exodeoxyribonuclease V gamma subunit